jgi:exodeoxyribonuclease VII large subunit
MAPNNVFSVSEITRSIKETLETGFTNVSIRGEISNCKLHTSGHLYFTLKDEFSQISAVMWRSRVGALAFTPQDGISVVVRGRITVYEVRGVYQIDAMSIVEAGEGELQAAFERLKKKLAAEGLFAQDRKKPLPRFPERIGIVTSETGAAIRDMLNILSRRWPVAEVVLVPVQVQGAGAAEQIAGAIATLNKLGGIDVIIAGRGGGSLEDLWAFNEEIVARAIFASKVPIISAVGHEIDFTIADFVADLRAPTPSAAAELVAPDMREIIDDLEAFQATAGESIRDMIQIARERVRSLVLTYSFNKPRDLVREHSQHVDELRRSLQQLTTHRFEFVGQHLANISARMTALNPAAVLERGYAIVRKERKAVARRAGLKNEDAIEIQFHDGVLPAIVKN